MKNRLNKIQQVLSSVIMMLLIICSLGCETSVQPRFYNGDDYIRFNRELIPLFVQEDQETFEIEISLVTDEIPTSDVFASIEVLDGSSAQAGIHYDLISNEVRIEAGEILGSFEIQVYKAALNEPVVLNLSLGGDNFNQTARIVMQNPIRDALFGDYELQYEWFFGTTDIFNQTLIAGSQVDEVIAPDMLEPGFDITMKVQPTDDQNLIGIVIERQNAWVSNNFGQATVQSESIGIFDIESGRVELTLRHNVSAGSFGAHPLVMQKTTQKKVL